MGELIILAEVRKLKEEEEDRKLLQDIERLQERLHDLMQNIESKETFGWFPHHFEAMYALSTCESILDGYNGYGLDGYNGIREENEEDESEEDSEA
tara:strand:- start:180 stop:467 length:288 start_codon:yes stop_codon:yes gene_type:complete